MTVTSIVYPQKPNGNTLHEPEARYQAPSMMWLGMPTIRAMRLIQLARKNLMFGDCMTCWAMSASGWRIAMREATTVTAPQPIRLGHRRPKPRRPTARQTLRGEVSAGAALSVEVAE